MIIVKYYSKIFLSSSRIEKSPQNTLPKPIDSRWFKNVSLELSKSSACQFFFHKKVKFYKDILPHQNKKTFFVIKNIFDILMIKWTQGFLNFDGDLFCMNKPYFCRNLLLTDWRHIHRKNTIEICSIYWNGLLRIFQTENKLSKNLIMLPTFSANKVPYFYVLKISKSVLFAWKKLLPPSFEILIHHLPP